jgi:hypothetical protein
VKTQALKLQEFDDYQPQLLLVCVTKYSACTLALAENLILYLLKMLGLRESSNASP